MIKKKIFLPLILVFVLVLSACSPDNTGDPEPNIPEEIPPVEEEVSGDDSDIEEPDIEEPDANEASDDIQEEDARVYTDIKLKAEEAFDIYMEKYSATKVKKIELDTDMGKYVYEVEGFDGEYEYEIKIDSINGDVLKEEKDSDDDNEVEVTRAHAEKVQVLVDQAFQEAGEDSKLDEWILEEDDGIITLEVEIDTKGNDDMEYTYNIETGELIEIDD